MDKKNTIIGALFFAAAFVLMLWSGMDRDRQVQQWRKDHPAEAAAMDAAAAKKAAGVAPAAAGNATAAANPGEPGLPVVEIATPPAPDGPTGTPALPAAEFVLQNDYIAVTLTEAGGAIKTVALKKFLAHLNQPEPVLFNEGAEHLALGLALPVSTGPGNLSLAPWLGHFGAVTAQFTPTSVTFQQQRPDGVDVTRTYTIRATEKEGDPYVIAHSTTFTNHSDKQFSLARLFVSAGTAPPTPGAGSAAAQYLDFGYYDGSSARFVTTADFAGSPGFFGLIGVRPPRPHVFEPRPASSNLQWVAVKNEFFTGVLTPRKVAGSGFYTQGVQLKIEGTSGLGVTGDIELNLGVLLPATEKKVELDYYVGPKEYVRLDRLGNKQDLVMEFGWTGWLSKPLLLVLIALHSALVQVSPAWAWGWAIVTITILIKLLTFPLTAMQVKSAKRMSQIQKPLAELREKYKDNPQKLQTEMMELFKKNNVNPAAGCFPMLIQLPVFLAFYSMLRTASELRFASFLWMPDLAASDTVGHLWGVPINILPLIMSLTMFVQMRMTPSPTADNTQKQIFQFMPFMFLFFFYSMPAGMILYWTCQNLFTILQQFITNRMKDAPAPTPGQAPAKGATRAPVRR